MLKKFETMVRQLVGTVTPEAFEGNVLGHFPEVVAIFQGASRFKATNEDFKKTTDILRKDAVRSISLLKKSPTSQFWRRTTIKSIFAWFEGQIFLMKRVALERFGHLEVEFTTADLALLREDKYALNDKGETRTTNNNYQKFIPNYQFAFKCYAKAHAAGIQFDKSKMPALERLEKVRNRLTHPKGFADLDVTDEEIQLASEVLQWHLDQSAAFFNACCCQKPQSVKPIARVSTRLHAKKPVVLLWHDGTVFEFLSKRSARQFARAKVQGKTEWPLLVFSLKEIEAAQR